MASDLRCEEVLHILEEDDEIDTSREFETMMAGKLAEKFREIEFHEGFFHSIYVEETKKTREIHEYNSILRIFTLYCMQ